MKNFSYVCAIFLTLASSSKVTGQAQVRKLSPNINHPSINVSVPFVNLDGTALLYLSDYADDNKIVMNFSSRTDGVNWKDPVVLPRAINNGQNYLKGFTLSPDGKTMYLTNSRTNGMGGFDIYKLEQKGSGWGDMTNLGLPFNSKLNDGSPTFSADGMTAYFMRCEKMTFEKAENCKLFMTRKKNNGQWDEPKELPASVNTGNSQTPRIMGDGETLIFSSNKLTPSKGGMDLYMTRWNGTIWSAPVPLDFVNTPGDDQFVSAMSLGRYLMKDAPGQRKSEIVEVLFPPAVKPKVTMKVEGMVSGQAYISIYNQKEQRKIFDGRPNPDGSFIAYLNEGNIYDLSIEPEQDSHTFFSKQFDLTSDKFPMVEKVSASLKPVAKGDELELAGVGFKERSSELTTASNQELRRVVRMMKGNPSVRFLVDVALYGFRKDSVQSDPDLTELEIDSLKIPITYTVTDTTSADSIKTLTRDSVVVKKTYHNDRTPQQGLEVMNYLVGQGVSAKNLTLTHRAEAMLPDKKKFVVKIIAQ